MEPTTEETPYLSPNHRSTDIAPRASTGRWEMWSGIIVATVSNVAAVAAWLTLLDLPPGSAIRPMGLATLNAVIAELAFAVGVPLCCVGAFCVSGWRRGVALAGVVLSLTPFPLGSLTLHAMAWLVPFTLED